MEAVKSPTEQRVLLRNVSWETYERLVAEREERQVPRFFYDRGVLEIVSPSTEHEAISRLVAALVGELAVALEIDVFGAGSTTFDREDVSGGFEPDQSFYFSENAGRVRGKKRIDLNAGDPPPDLVVEVDITSPSLDKLPIYARLGVREVWRYAGERAAIWVLRDSAGEPNGEAYTEVARSTALAPVTSDALAHFIGEGLTSSYPAWARKVREWASDQGILT